MSPQTVDPGGGLERRRYPRSRIPFYVHVSGVDSDGEEFDGAAILHDISRGGLYIRIPHCVTEGSKILCVVRFSTGGDAGPSIPVRGTVLRTEIRTLGICDLAIEFNEPLQQNLGH